MRPGLLECGAVVLRTLDYGENDRIVGLLTPAMGKLSAFAPCARRSRRRYPGLDLFARVRAQLRPPGGSREGLWRLEKLELADPHFGLRADLRRLALAGYLAECTWSLAGEGDPQPGLHAWWEEALRRLEGREAAEDLSPGLELELLALLGHAPRLEACTECGGPQEGEAMFFSFERGGSVCRKCPARGEGRWLPANVLAGLGGGGALEKRGKEAARGAVGDFVRYTVGRELKSRKFCEEVFGGPG